MIKPKDLVKLIWQMLFNKGPTKQYALKPSELSFLPNPDKGIPADQLKDVIIYKNRNPNYHKYLNFFCLTQYALWSAMALNIMSMKELPPVSEEERKSKPFWKNIHWVNPTTKTLCAGVTFLIGNGILIAGWVFTLRSVRYLILRKDRLNCSIITFTPFGTNRVTEVALKDMSCEGARHQHGYQLPIRVRGRYFNYILDLHSKSATFPSPQLFDRTAGIRRF